MTRVWRYRHMSRTFLAGALIAAVLAPLSLVALATPAAADWSPAQSIAPVTNTYGSNGYLEASFSSVSCPTAEFCLAAQQNGQVIPWNGNWQSADEIDDNPVFGVNNIPTYVSCASATFCMAVVYEDAMIWNGTSWTSPSQIDSTSLTAVDCLSSSFCMAADSNGAIVNWNGTQWSAYAVSNRSPITSVSCTTSMFCIAATNDGHVLQWNGSTWSSPVLVDSGNEITSVSCLSSTECVASDDVGDVVEWNGSTWVSNSVDPSGLVALSCAGSSCLAVDGSAESLSGIATSWTTPTVIGLGNVDPVAAVSCATASFCMAVGSGIGRSVERHRLARSDPGHAVRLRVTFSFVCHRFDSALPSPAPPWLRGTALRGVSPSTSTTPPTAGCPRCPASVRASAWPVTVAVTCCTGSGPTGRHNCSKALRTGRVRRRLRVLRKYDVLHCGR